MHPQVVGETVAAAILAAVELGILPGGADVGTSAISEIRAQVRAARCRPSLAARMAAAINNSGMHQKALSFRKFLAEERGADFNLIHKSSPSLQPQRGCEPKPKGWSVCGLTLGARVLRCSTPKGLWLK